MASTYIDLSDKTDELVNVIQESESSQIHFESKHILQSILSELKSINLHLSVVSDLEIECGDTE